MSVLIKIVNYQYQLELKVTRINACILSLHHLCIRCGVKRELENRGIDSPELAYQQVTSQEMIIKCAGNSKQPAQN